MTQQLESTPHATKSFSLVARGISSLVLVPFGYLATSFIPVNRELRGFFAVALAIGCVELLFLGAPWVWTRADQFLETALFWRHSGGPRVIPLSHIEALVQRGNTEAALQEVEHHLQQYGLTRELCELALTVYQREGQSSGKSEALLRRMRVECPAEFEMLATCRLIDIYLADPTMHGRALVELRRLIDRFPQSAEADGARRYLQEVKSRGAS